MRKSNLTAKEKAFLLANYADMPNDRIAEALGIKIPRVIYFGHKVLKLSKSELFKENVLPRKKSETLKKTLEAEKRRVLFGLPQATKRTVIRQKNWKMCLRYRLKQKGYILDEDKRIAYYNDTTKRCFGTEKRKRWYTFEPVDKKTKIVNKVNDELEGSRFVPEPPPVNDVFLFT